MPNEPLEVLDIIRVNRRVTFYIDFYRSYEIFFYFNIKHIIIDTGDELGV